MATAARQNCSGGATQRTGTRRRGATRSPLVVALVAACILIGSGYLHRLLNAEVAAALDRLVQPAAPLESVPLELGPWVGRDVPFDADALDVVSFDDLHLNRVYRHRQTGHTVALFVGYVGRPRVHLGHRPDVCFVAQGWEQVREEPVTWQTSVGREMPSRLYEFERPGLGGGLMRVLGTYMINGRYAQEPDEFRQWNKRGAGLLGERPGYLTRVQVTLEASDDRAADLALLQDFSERVAEPIAQIMPYWVAEPEVESP